MKNTFTNINSFNLPLNTIVLTDEEIGKENLVIPLISKIGKKEKANCNVFAIKTSANHVKPSGKDN